MMRDIGKNIRDLRQQKHLTQEELAEQLFVTRQTVSNSENGRTRPEVDQILRLAEIFDTDANAAVSYTHLARRCGSVHPAPAGAWPTAPPER